MNSDMYTYNMINAIFRRKTAGNENISQKDIEKILDDIMQAVMENVARCVNEVTNKREKT